MASGDSRREVNEMIFLVDKNKVKHYTSDSDYTIPTDSINAIPFGFALSSDWEGYTLTSQITKADKTVNILLDKNNAGMIPPDMEEGIWNVSLFGVKDGSKRNTTIPATLKLVKSGYNPQGQPPIQPPEDLYAKLIKQIEEAFKKISKLEESIDKVGKLETGKPTDPALEPEEYPEYKQPLGAHDAYNTGDKVTFKGKKYECIKDNCVWDYETYPDGWKIVS